MIMKTVKVISAGKSISGKPDMGSLVDEGILTKEYLPNRHHDSGPDIIWTNISKDVIVENDFETIMPGQFTIWEK